MINPQVFADLAETFRAATAEKEAAVVGFQQASERLDAAGTAVFAARRLLREYVETVSGTKIV